LFLLGTAALLAAAAGRRTPALSSIPDDAVHLSVISAARARHEILLLAPSPDRSTYEQNLRELVAMVSSEGHVLPVDAAIAECWATLLPMSLPVIEPDGSSAELDDDNRLVVATAIVRNLTLLEAPQPYHAALAGLRLRTCPP
jgi:hypothetical protein